MPPTFTRAYPPAEPPAGPAVWLPFQGDKLLVREAPHGVALAYAEPADLAPLAPEQPIYLGTLGERPCLVFEVPAEQEPPPGWRPLSLRALFGQVDEAEYGLAGYAWQILYWRRTSRFCPVCGGATEPVGGDWGRRCTVCGHSRYPQISPAVLALVHNGDYILLTHKPGWGPMYSIIAGFVEPNESLEECVHREVLEEVNLEVADVIYQGSQPWPFPHQLMIGFFARYRSGEPQPDTTELDEARWFHVRDLPMMPMPLSLSRQLIDRWIESRHSHSEER
ncbi:MAG TPA: NAD(+) diphosphatase [Roseiflexaceae bacterium]|nr:NAD(+) diphosphatase [Roseiflexaceae bacterium]